jgi:PDZ domain
MKYQIIATLIFAGLILFASTGLTQEPTEQTRLVVKGLVPDSPAQKAGVLPNDILLKYDGKPVQTVKELNDLKALVKTDSVEIVVNREEKELKFKIPAGSIGVFLNEYLPDLSYKADAVVIEGIPKLGWDTGKDNTFFGALEAVANFLGVKKDYIDINGMSGGAFRIQFCKDWCPSSPDPTCGYNVGEDALRALGLEYQALALSKDGKNKDAMKQAIMESIAKKIPVIAIDLIEIAEWGIITGYQNNGEELLCRTYFDRRESYEIAQKFPFAIYIITGKKEPPADIDNYQKSFEIALKNLKTEKYDNYYSGIAGFNQWIKELKGDNFAAFDSEKYYNAALANAWIYDRLTADRANAVEYLGRINSQFPKASAEIDELTKLYKDENELLKQPKNIVIYSYAMKSREDWNPERRAKEIEVLGNVKTKEEAALKLWEQIAKLTSKPKK